MQRPRSVTLAFLLSTAGLVLAPTGAAALEEIFHNDFEGNAICLWSSATMPCLGAGAAAALVADQVIPACIPRTEGTVTGGSYTLCPTQVCADGVTPGCAAIVRTGNAVVDLAGPTVALDVTGDDVDLPVNVTLLGSSAGCTLEVRSATGTATSTLAVSACLADYQLVTGVATTSVTIDGTFTLAGGSLTCQSAAALVPLVEGALLAELEAEAEAALTEQLAAVFGGRFLCPAPPG